MATRKPPPKKPAATAAVAADAAASAAGLAAAGEAAAGEAAAPPAPPAEAASASTPTKAVATVAPLPEKAAAKTIPAELLQRVQRVTVIEAGGRQHTKSEPIEAREVLAFRDYGTHVVVVTIDGQKFSSAAV